MQSVEIHEVESLGDLYRKRLARAERAGDADELLGVAEWALQHGMLLPTYEAVLQRV